VSDNRVTEVGKDYFDRSAILVTYFDGAEIVHNELSQGAYDAIDSGWGWGVPDAGGSHAYQGRGTYLFTKRHSVDDPTVNRNIHIARNVMWDFKQEGSDGGILYNLGSAPGSSWEGNHVMGSTGYKLYFDAGTRYMTAKDNVLSAGGDLDLRQRFRRHFVDTGERPAQHHAGQHRRRNLSARERLQPGPPGATTPAPAIRRVISATTTGSRPGARSASPSSRSPLRRSSPPQASAPSTVARGTVSASLAGSTSL